jgi:large subunit ribosomal protein L19
MNPIMDLVNKRSLKKSIPDIATGDVVKVSQKIVEGAKTRSQIFEGIVISREGGNGVTASITVRKIASGVGVEKKFLLNSPNVESVKVLRSSRVRRKKIFFLRGLTGKAAKLKENQRKMLGDIGLKEDEVESAETTEDLAQPVEEENQELGFMNQEEDKKPENKEVKIEEEPVAEEIKEVKPEEPVAEVLEENVGAEDIQPEKVEEKEEPTTENNNEEKTE